VVNGEFEQRDATDSTLPDGWTRLQSSAETAMLVKHGDGHALRLRNHPKRGEWQNLFQNLWELKPNTKYLIAYDAHTNGKGAGIVSVWLFNPATKERTWLAGVKFTESDWQAHTLTFATPPSLRGEVQLNLTVDDVKNPAVMAEFDNITMRAASG